MYHTIMMTTMAPLQTEFAHIWIYYVPNTTSPKMLPSKKQVWATEKLHKICLIHQKKNLLKCLSGQLVCQKYFWHKLWMYRYMDKIFSHFITCQHSFSLNHRIHVDIQNKFRNLVFFSDFPNCKSSDTSRKLDYRSTNNFQGKRPKKKSTIFNPFYYLTCMLKHHQNKSVFQTNIFENQMSPL